MINHFLRIDDIGLWRYQKECMNEIFEYAGHNNLPLTLGVIADQLEEKTAKVIKQYGVGKGGLMEIFLHGDTHDLKEFSASRSLNQQLQSIVNGERKIEAKIGVKPVGFIPPEHICTANTITALEKCGYRIVSKQYKATLDGWIFYKIGRILRRWFLFGKKVSYHPRNISGLSLAEYSISIELARNMKVKSCAEILEEYNTVTRFTKLVGFLIHPQVLANSADKDAFYEFIELAKSQQWRFSALSTLNTSQAKLF